MIVQRGERGGARLAGHLGANLRRVVREHSFEHAGGVGKGHALEKGGDFGRRLQFQQSGRGRGLGLQEG